ncbi:MAG: hydrogenase expression/formation protein HypE [Betaproteobacteria bacterium]
MSANVKPGYARALDIKRGRVDLGHGGGGRAMIQLVRELFARHLGNPWLDQGNDGTLLPPVAGRLVVSTDSHVVSPLFFPGGDIGCLAVHGTINDLAVMGATPLWITAGFIIEEGFPLSDLDRIAASMARACRESGVALVAGDTKVVEKGKGDGLFITTTGIGAAAKGATLSGDQARPGDAVLLSGTLGDHGMAIMSQRENLGFDAPIQSDTAPLCGLTAMLMARAGDTIRLMRDPTRGGLAATANEIAHQARVGIVLDESSIPVRPEVEAACELLGLDPLNVANEGKLVLVCAETSAEALLQTMREHPLGRNAARIGSVIADDRHFVQMRTRLGGRRMVDWLNAEQLPRIC